MRCHNCGQENENNSTSCIFCGSPLMPEDAIEDDAVDYSAAEQGYSRTASRTKFSIIISALIILLLLVFVFQIYRRLTADNKDASGLFQEATVYDPPLLLPSTPTEPTEPTTNPSKSSTTITSSTDAQLQMPTSSSSTTVSTVPSATTSSSHSIKVNTVPVTEVDSSLAVDATDPSLEDPATVSTYPSETITTTESTTSSTTVTSTTTEETKPEPSAVMRIDRVDSSESPLVRLDYAIRIDDDEDGKPYLKEDQLMLRIFEKMSGDDLEWVEQIPLHIKETSNITFVVDFSIDAGSSIKDAGSSIKNQLQIFIGKMNLNHDKSQDETAESDDEEEELEQEEEPRTGQNDWDMFSLISYGDSVDTRIELTPYYFDAKKAIQDSSSTSKEKILLHEAMLNAINFSSEAEHASAVVLTDGRYTENEYTLADVEALAKEKKIPVHIIYLNDEENPDRIGERHDKAKLEEFALRTGGALSSVSEQDEWAENLAIALESALQRDREGTFLIYESTHVSSEAGSKNSVRIELYFVDEKGKEHSLAFDTSEYTVPDKELESPGIGFNTQNRILIKI